MTQHEDLIREAFESHEHLAPSLGAVYNGSQELSRRYQRRRRGAQVVGGTVLGAGLLAAAAHLPSSMLPGATVPAPPAGVGATTPTPPGGARPGPTTLNESEINREIDAFTNAGYGYEDAVRLAALWHTSADLRYVKAEAGSELLAGRTLPIPPGSATRR